MKLCYSANKAYLPGMLMATLSAAIKTKEALEIYLLTGDFTEVNPKFTAMEQEDADFLESVLILYSPSTKVILIDVSKDYKEEILSCKNAKSMYSPYTLLRLFIDKYVTEGRVLYIDVDTIVLNDLAEFYYIDMENNQVAMVKDAGYPSWFIHDYCNAGVTLFNLDNIKGTDRFEKCREMIKTRKMDKPDQSAVNKIFRDKKMLVDRKFNEQKKAKDDTVIRHYCDSVTLHGIIKAKPWADNFHEKRKEYVSDFAILLAREYLKQNEEGKEVSLIQMPETKENAE